MRPWSVFVAKSRPGRLRDRSNTVPVYNFDDLFDENVEFFDEQVYFFVKNVYMFYEEVDFLVEQVDFLTNKSIFSMKTSTVFCRTHRVSRWKSNCFYEKVDFDNSFPEYILKNKQKFIEWIL